MDWTDVWVNETMEMSWNDTMMRPVSDQPVDDSHVDHSGGEVVEWSIRRCRKALLLSQFGPVGGH